MNERRELRMEDVVLKWRKVVKEWKEVGVMEGGWSDGGRLE